MIEWIFKWFYISSNKEIFLIYLITLLLMILVTIYLVRKELGKEDVNK